jgi:hypothetical protein
MKKILLLVFIAIFNNINLFAQTTSPLPYCYAGFSFLYGDTVGSDWINSVQLGTLNNVSNAECPAPHYIFYNNLSAPSLAPNTNYTLSLNFSVGGGAGYAALIDYNHDDIFDSTELVAGIKASVGMSLGPNVPVTATISVPATALAGNTRMRIRISEDDNYHATHIGAYELACDSLDSTAYGGETEDYIVNILSVSGINEINNKPGFSLYPNPVNNLLTIENNLTGSLTYDIYNITGSEILRGTIKNAKEGIDVSMLNSGLYFIELAENGQLAGYEKFIKQ